jgi:hypothetical protein
VLIEWLAAQQHHDPRRSGEQGGRLARLKDRHVTRPVSIATTIL